MMPSVMRKPATRSKSSPGVRIVTDSETSPIRISSGSSVLTSSLRQVTPPPAATCITRRWRTVMPTTIAIMDRDDGCREPSPSGKITRAMADVSDTGDLLSELASRLSGARGAAGGVPPLDIAERARLLRIARDVAHATERQNAPLAAYLIGRSVQDAVRPGVSEADALDQAESVVRVLIGDAAD